MCVGSIVRGGAVLKAHLRSLGGTHAALPFVPVFSDSVSPASKVLVRCASVGSVI